MIPINFYYYYLKTDYSQTKDKILKNSKIYVSKEGKPGKEFRKEQLERQENLGDILDGQLG